MIDVQPIFSRIVLPPVTTEKGLAITKNTNSMILPKFEEDQLFIAGQSLKMPEIPGKS